MDSQWHQSSYINTYEKGPGWGYDRSLCAEFGRFFFHPLIRRKHHVISWQPHSKVRGPERPTFRHP